MTEILNYNARPSWLRSSLIGPLLKHGELMNSHAEVGQEETGYFIYDLDYLERHLANVAATRCN